MGLAVAGLAVWVLCNVLFGVYYYRDMRKDGEVKSIVDKMSNKSKCIYYGVIVCSVAFSLRTYRVLYCGLFRGVSPYPIKKLADAPDRDRIRKGSEGKIANEDINVIVPEKK